MTYRIVVDGEKFDADFVGALSLDNLQRLADTAFEHTSRPITRLRSHPATRRAYLLYMEACGSPVTDEVPFEADITMQRDVIVGYVERPL